MFQDFHPFARIIRAPFSLFIPRKEWKFEPIFVPEREECVLCAID